MKRKPEQQGRTLGEIIPSMKEELQNRSADVFERTLVDAALKAASSGLLHKALGILSVWMSKYPNRRSAKVEEAKAMVEKQLADCRARRLYLKSIEELKAHAKRRQPAVSKQGLPIIDSLPKEWRSDRPADIGA